MPKPKKKLSSFLVRPLGDRVVVRPLTPEEAGLRSASGIIIPDTAKEKPMEGKVVAVGNGKRLETGERQAMELKVNDRVLFSKYAGTEIKLDGEEHLILREDDILGILE